jgi:DNA-binding NarL/FixJ family response regulator
VNARRVVVADDDLLLREGLADLLTRSGYQVVGRTGSAPELIELVRDHEPDLAIIDLRMPHSTEGLDAARVIRRECPQTAILVLSAYIETEGSDLLHRCPRSGYLLKSSVLDVDAFMEALEQILGGGSVLDPALLRALSTPSRADGPLDRLSPRERDVLALMAEGRSNAGIADLLGLSKATVERYVHSILVKLPPSETPDNHRRVRAVLTFLEAR